MNEGANYMATWRARPGALLHATYLGRGDVERLACNHMAIADSGEPMDYRTSGSSVGSRNCSHPDCSRLFFNPEDPWA